MIRDLTLLSDKPEELEGEIQRSPDWISPELFKDFDVARGNRIFGSIGDVVVFTLKTRGSYSEMETLWGAKVPLDINKHYIGVLCERGSTKLMTAEFPRLPFPITDGLELQFVAQAGGIGYVTGFSPQLKKEAGIGVACDVELEGIVWSEKGAVNISETAIAPPKIFKAEEIPPNILILGTATDVGKTTIAKELIGGLSKKFACGAVKASGTGWYEDSLLHLNAGALPVLNYTFAGLPTTYYVDEKKYVKSMKAIYWLMAHPEKMKREYLPPEERDRNLRRLDVIVTEHGGDLVWANIPSFLKNKELMRSVFCIVVCCESAVGLLGALNELKRVGVRNSRIMIYASVPLTNPEAFFKRVQTLIGAGITGVVDVNKPQNTGDARKAYSIHYKAILSPDELVEILGKDLNRLEGKKRIGGFKLARGGHYGWKKTNRLFGTSGDEQESS